MSKAEELAEEMLRLADLSDAGRGPAKSDPRRQAAAELRRLAALEKAIMDAEPVAWSAGIEWHPIKHYQSEQIQKLTRKKQAEFGFTVPLYTLNGIKKP